MSVSNSSEKYIHSEKHVHDEPVIHFLEKSHRENRLVHGYLFFGGNKTDKLAVAKQFAQLVLAVDEVGAHLIETEAHANVLIIRPDGKNIKKEQIVFLKSEIGKKSIENKAKIYIIEDADKMSISATNSLLKFLEEPAADVHIILIAPSKEALLPTIVSRTVNLGFRKSIEENKLIEAPFLEIIEALEDGSVGQVMMAKYPEVFKTQITEFLDAYQHYLRHLMEKTVERPNDLKRCIQKLRAIEEARRHLQANINVSLCLDQLWLNF